VLATSQNRADGRPVRKGEMDDCDHDASRGDTVDRAVCRCKHEESVAHRLAGQRKDADCVPKIPHVAALISRDVDY
jgi:hypothetical protein